MMEDKIATFLGEIIETNDRANADKLWNWAVEAKRLTEIGDFESGLFYINLCLANTNMPGRTDVMQLDCGDFSNLSNTTNLPMSEVLTLLEKRCIVLLKMRKYDKVVQDAQELLHQRSNHSLAYKCLLASLCKLNQLDRVSEVLKNWKIECPHSLEMLECRTKLESLMEAVSRGIDPRQAFSNLDDLLGLNYDRLLKQPNDESHWKYRPLPCGRSAFVLCLQHRFGHCSLGQKCPDAHGEFELEEWKARMSENNVNAEVVKPPRSSLIMQRLVNRIAEAGHESLILTEDTASHGVKIKCLEPLKTVISSRKVKNFHWKFAVESKQPLLNVCLLHETHRQYFRISSAYLHGPGTKIGLTPAANEDDQLQVVEVYTDNLGSQNNTYSVTVCFNPELFGNFHQIVVFDFGFEPIPIRKITVEVHPPGDEENDNHDTPVKNGHHSEVSPSEEEVKIVRKKGTWNFGNADIVNGSNGDRVSSEKLGFALINGIVKPCSNSDTKEVLVRDNYKEKMRFFLTEEERARQEIISKYNLSAPLQISDQYQMTSGFFEGESKYAVDGSLFGRMTLFRDVSEDTAVGRLILRSCRSVLLTKTEVVQGATGKPRVYWCEISDKTKNSIYIQLGGFCVKDLNLKKDDLIMFDIQFQLDRTAFMEQKDVIDRLTDEHLDMLFPDFRRNYHIPWSPLMQWDGTEKVSHRRLNPKQKEALIAVTHEGSHIPPILLIGPFGTGKTFTLAQCIRKILMQPSSRVMICTQSNSAADLYIKEYLHQWCSEGFDAARTLRIYYAFRSFKTVHPTVLNYCIKEHGRFRNPGKEDILAHRVIVVTLASSYLLMDLGLPADTFSHIFLDEAAQAMESEAITPLLLAGGETKLVLAGDHMQLSPELFCDQAKNFHSSLLERLHCSYPESHPCKLMLCENYRSHAAIIKFASESFYNKKLECGMSQPVHGSIYPLSFYAARGEDVQEEDSTSYYNMAEVFEVTEKVAEIISSWPKSWGDYRDESAIGVLTPYADQVSKIRARLRKKGLTYVSVERVLNVQGKQFRAVILSTVRTHKPWVRILPEAVGKEIDFGFFSNPKLLNTALTRAQSLVAVVGDPVSLCSVGKCRVLWEDFIRVCDENRSLHGISYMQIKQNILGVEMRNTWGLNPLANEFKPKSSFVGSNNSVMEHSSSLTPKPYAKPSMHSPTSLYHQMKHSPVPPEAPTVASPQQFGGRSLPGGVPTGSSHSQIQHPVGGIQPSHLPTYPVIFQNGYRPITGLLPAPQPVIRPFGVPHGFPNYNTASASIPAPIPNRFANVIVPHTPVNSFVTVPHPPLRFVRPGYDQVQPAGVSSFHQPASSSVTPHGLGSQYYAPSNSSNESVSQPQLRKEVPQHQQAYSSGSHQAQAQQFSGDIPNRQQAINAQHVAGVPLFRRGMEASSNSSNMSSYSTNPGEHSSSNMLPNLDKMSQDEILMLQEIFDNVVCSGETSSNTTNMSNNEEKIRNLRSKLGLTVSEPFKFSSSSHNSATSGNNPNFGLSDLTPLDAPRRSRNQGSLESPMACTTTSTNGMNNNNPFTNPRGTSQHISYHPSNSSVMSSSQSNVWFSNPSSTYMTTNYSSNPERSGSSNSNPSANSSLGLQGYGNNSQSTYRINSQTYLSHHHSGDMSSTNNYPHMSDIRSHPQPQSSLSAPSSSAAVGGNSASSGTSRSYANVVKQATPAPAINNNNSQQQDSDSQKYIALLPKQYQVQGSSAGGGIRISKGTLPAPDFMSNAMNSRKSQR